MKVSTNHRNHTANQEVLETRTRFGGVDLGASFTGMLAAIGTLVLLGGLFSFFGAIGYDFIQDQNSNSQIGGGVALGALAIFISYLVGGQTAARSARYNGVINGLMVVVWTFIIAGLFAFLAWALNDTNTLTNNMFPSWLTDNDFTFPAVMSGIFGLVIMVLGSIAGGKAGSFYHKKVDAALAQAILTTPNRQNVKTTVVPVKEEILVTQTHATNTDGAISAREAAEVFTQEPTAKDDVVIDTTDD